MLTFVFNGRKQDLAAVVQERFETLYADETIRNRAMFARYAALAIEDAESLPDHVAGVLVKFETHADEHNTTVSYSLAGIHLSSRHFAEIDEAA